MIDWETQQRKDKEWYSMHVNKNIALHLHIDYFTLLYKLYCKTLHGKSFSSAVEIGTSDTGGFLAILPSIRKRVAIDSAVDLLKTLDMLPLSSHIRYDQGFAENLPYKTESVPLVICSNALDHVKDMQKSADEIVRILSKDGYFLFVSFLKVKKPHPWTFQTPEEARALFPSLKVVEDHYIVDDRPFTRRNDTYLAIFQKQ